MQTNLKFVHTSFHGVGHDYVQLAFKAFGFQPPIPVPEQKDPDPDFSTVKCPNPEEGESVLVYQFLLHQIERKSPEIYHLDEKWIGDGTGSTWLSTVFTHWEICMIFFFVCYV